MNFDKKVQKIVDTKINLKSKLISEGLTKNEYSLLKEMDEFLKEIEYEGPERMEPGIERRITTKTTPYHEHPAFEDMDEDFLDTVASKRFKDSVEKVRRYLGDTTIIQGSNPLMQLMSSVMRALQKIMTFEGRNKERLEEMAINLVMKELEIPEDSLQWDVKLVQGGMSAAEGMQAVSQNPTEDEVEDAFEMAEQHTDELDDFMNAMDKFNLEKAKRKFINSLIQGAAFKGGHMYVFLADELNRMNPEIMQLYGVTQSLMEHLYWIYPDMEMMVSSMSGQLGQSEVETETDPPTVKARASTLPLLIHEMVKGVYEVFGTHGLPDEPKQSEMVIDATDSLAGEVWDSRFGPVFWERLVRTFPMEIIEEGKRYLQHYLITRIFKLKAKEFMSLVSLVVSNDKSKNLMGERKIRKMVDEIIEDLRRRDFENEIEKYENDDDDFNSDDWDDFNIDDED
jgi:hypothetical protein